MTGVNRYDMVAALVKVANGGGWRSPLCESKDCEIVITFVTDEEAPLD